MPVVYHVELPCFYRYPEWANQTLTRQHVPCSLSFHGHDSFSCMLGKGECVKAFAISKLLFATKYDTLL